MANTAILVGNSQYRSLTDLSCCHDDLAAMHELLDAAAKYSVIEIIENVDADKMKSAIRATIEKHHAPEEVFFYFTGHGYQQDDEFYFCTGEFNPNKPNQTGISNGELHTLLRLANADVVVKVIDACNSGTTLIKSDGSFAFQDKHGFKSLIQISSCLQTQNSLTGNPLSFFTERFRESALRKKEGVIYYTDLIYSLRDEFLKNDDQTPFFVSQGTGRERFVQDARCLDGLRTKLTKLTELPPQAESESEETSVAESSLRSLLEEVEQDAATPARIEYLVNAVFDGLIEKISIDEFSEFFDAEIAENSEFKEPTAEAFIIRILTKERRSDEFVTVERNKRQSPLYALGTAALLGISGSDQTYREVYDLRLNCKMNRAQIRIKMTPKYHSLKQIVLVVTCAPSLEYCYIFEIGSQHGLKDFGEFEVTGTEIVRRWYRLRWTESAGGIVEGIASKLHEVIREHLESTQERLSED